MTNTVGGRPEAGSALGRGAGPSGSRQEACAGGPRSQGGPHLSPKIDDDKQACNSKDLTLPPANVDLAVPAFLPFDVREGRTCSLMLFHPHWVKTALTGSVSLENT